jgi:nucleoside 2-deoxyribosyltransferase
MRRALFHIKKRKYKEDCKKRTFKEKLSPLLVKQSNLIVEKPNYEMKIFVTSKFDGSLPKDTQNVIKVLEEEGFETRCFVRDYPPYQDFEKMMVDVTKEIKNCDALIIDMSEKSTGRTIELGIAYALGKMIIVIVKSGTRVKETVIGVADAIIEYDNLDNLKGKINKK